MAEDSLRRPFPERHLRDEIRPHPPRDTRDRLRRRRIERARVDRPLSQHRLEHPQVALLEARADLAHVPEHAVVVDAEQERAEVAGAVALARRPPADDELLLPPDLDLAPVRRALAGLVPALHALGHEALEPALPRRLEERGAVAGVPRRHLPAAA